MATFLYPFPDRLHPPTKLSPTLLELSAISSSTSMEQTFIVLYFYFLCFFYFFFFPGHILFFFLFAFFHEALSALQIFENWFAGEMRSQIYPDESCTLPLMSVLCSVFIFASCTRSDCSVHVCLLSVTHLETWLVERKQCVTYSLLIRFNRSMSAAFSGF